ncbi:hypothetical protein TrLO_g11107 [Triparma laevis f. longispina]|uniref:Uncharacterized protein n=1 Tax=Triparma laevis f. longispina TaxID=1714387 RepID=A0A9W7F3C2_9STRA|nr:hypothetical protein TrLO_g11107 [Triparma laevis f. longispina]
MCVDVIFYSCFWLPLSIAQGFAIMPIVALLVLPPIIISELVFAPFHAIHCFYVMIITERLGVTLKLFGVLILPFAFLALPVITILLSLLVVITITPFSMVLANTGWLNNGEGCQGKDSLISPTCIIFGGAPSVFKHCTQAVLDAIDMHRHAIVTTLNDFKTLGPDEEKFDVHLLQVLVGFLQAVLSAVILLAVNGLTGLFMLPMIIFRAYVEYCDVSSKCMKDTPACIACALVPFPLILPAVVIVYVASIFLNIIWGVYCSMRAYHEGSVQAGVDLFFYCVAFYNAATTEAAGCGNSGSYVNWPTAKRDTKAEDKQRRRAERLENSPERRERAPYKRAEDSESATGSRMRMLEIWQNFFDMSSVDISTALQKGWIKRSEVDSLDPFLFTGVSAIVSFHCVQRSLAKHGPQNKYEVGNLCDALWPSGKHIFYPGKITLVDEDKKLCSIEYDDGDTLEECHFDDIRINKVFVLHSSVEVSDRNRPKNRLAKKVYEEMSKIMEKLDKCKLNEAEVEKLEQALIRADFEVFNTWSEGYWEVLDGLRQLTLSPFCPLSQ